MKTIVILINTDLKYNIRVVKTAVSLAEQYNVVIFCNGNLPPSQLISNNDRIKVFDLSASIKTSFLSQHLFIGNIFDSAYDTILTHLTQNHISPHLIYSVDLTTLKTGLKLSKQFKCKFIYDAYELYVETFNQYYPLHKRGLKRYLFLLLIFVTKHLNTFRERRFIKNVDLFITTCDSFMTYYKKMYRITKSLIIRNTPVFEIYDQIEAIDLHKTFNIDREKKIALYIGSFNAGRSLDKLILAGKYTAENVYILLLGNGTLMPYLQQLISENNLGHKVGIHGPYEMHLTLNYIKAADVGILFTDKTNLSKFLASANKVYDYMMAGIPTLLSDTPENRLVIEQSQSGQILKEISPVSIANGISQVLSSPNYITYKKNGLHYAELHGNWEIDKETLLSSIAEL